MCKIYSAYLDIKFFLNKFRKIYTHKIISTDLHLDFGLNLDFLKSVISET